MTKKQKKMLVRIILTAVMLAALYVIPVTGWLRLALYLAVYAVIGYDIMKKAGQGILNGRVFDENFLMAVATIGAFALAIYEKSGDYNEAIAVMLFYQIGELFQSYAVGKSRRNISALMDIRPDYANIEQDGQLVQVDPDEVSIGTVIVVQPGEKIPLDGIVAEGSSTLNTSALTGESLPRDAHEGDEVISGCINMTGVLKIRTTKVFGESTVSKILELVENSSSRKSRSEDFIAKFARIYTPVVCYSALALALLLVVALPAAYCLSRFYFKGRKVLNTLFMAGLFINVNYIVVPIFLMLRDSDVWLKGHFGSGFLLNNLVVLAVVYAATALPFTIYLLSGYFATLPHDFEEAAYIDGASYFSTMTRIIFPMAKPSIITIILFNFLSFWNEYIISMTLMSSTKAPRTLPVGLLNLMQAQQSAAQYGTMYAGLVLVMLPTLILYICVQRQLTQGMTVGGLKG